MICRFIFIKMTDGWTDKVWLQKYYYYSGSNCLYNNKKVLCIGALQFHYLCLYLCLFNAAKYLCLYLDLKQK